MERGIVIKTVLVVGSVVGLFFAYRQQCYYSKACTCYYMNESTVRFITDEQEIYLWELEEGQKFNEGGMYNVILDDRDTATTTDDIIVDIVKL